MKDGSKLDIDQITKQALDGDLSAQIKLAKAYCEGNSVEVDLPKASMWFINAAKNGHYGALKWLHKNADSGEIISQYNLAVMYENGEGVGRDVRLCLYYYMLAAEQGFQKSVDKLVELNDKYKIDEASPDFSEFLSDMLAKHSQ